MITDTDGCYFNCCPVLAVTLASWGVFEREWIRILSHTPSQIWMSPNTKWCDRACVIVLRRSHWRPPSSAFVLPGVFRELKSPRLRCDSMVLCNPQHAIICDTGPSTVWQLPPTTFWWPAVAPRPRSSSLAFYEPCRGSPWSCPSRSPGKEGKGSVFEMILKPFSHWHQCWCDRQTLLAPPCGECSLHTCIILSPSFNPASSAGPPGDTLVT